jgi:hypothetical protein
MRHMSRVWDFPLVEKFELVESPLIPAFSCKWGEEDPASHPRRQVGEAAAAVAHGFEFGKLLVAPVVAAALDHR